MPDGSASTPIKVLDIELTRPLAALSGLDGYAAAQGLVRAGGVPVGMVHVPLESGGCSSEALRSAVLHQLGRELAAHEVSLQDTPDRGPRHELSAGRVPSQDTAWPSITVAVCTRNRPADLATCLDSVCALDYPRLDVLVVDNAPSDDATAALLPTRYPDFRYVREPRPGLNWARNRALVDAAGEIIAYTDDDVVVDRGWARAIGAAFANAPADVMAVTGLVVPFELETEVQLQFERYGGFTSGFDREELRGGPDWGTRGVWHLAGMAQRFTGANMAFRREVFDEIGPFDPALGAGTPTNGGDDSEMLFRVLRGGFAIAYEPAAVVRHRHRREYDQLVCQISGWGTGYAAFLTRSALAHPSASLVYLLLGLRGLGHQLGRLAASVFRPPGFPRRLLRVEAAGMLAGPVRYWRARRKAAAIARAFEREVAGVSS
jgi:glycosyltransferase involved in cell wall biosynthesis